MARERVIPVLCGSFLAALLIAHPGVSANLFIQDIGGPESEDARRLLSTDDGGLLIAANTTASGGQLAFLELDEDGALLWDKMLAGPGWNMVTGVIQTSDGGYLALGNRRDMVTSQWFGFLLKLDADGAKEWDLLLSGDAASNLLYDAVEVSAGRYALAGDTESFGVSGRAGWLVMVDATGTAPFVEWAYAYDESGTDNFRGVVETDTGLAMAGFSSAGLDSKYDLWVVTAGADGQLEAQMIYELIGSSWSAPRAFHRMADGSLVVGATGGVAQEAELLKVEADLTPISWYSIGGPGSSEGLSFSATTGDGGLVFAGYSRGTIDPPAPDYLGWITTVDADLQVTASRLFGTLPGSDLLNGIAVARDGSWLAAVGSTTSFGSTQQMLVVKTSLELDTFDPTTAPVLDTSVDPALPWQFAYVEDGQIIRDVRNISATAAVRIDALGSGLLTQGPADFADMGSSGFSRTLHAEVPVCEAVTEHTAADTACCVRDGVYDDGNPRSRITHGSYVSCIAHAVGELRRAGEITGREGGRIVSAAAQSGVNK